MASFFFRQAMDRLILQDRELRGVLYDVVSVKRRTWRTLWLVERTFRERRMKDTIVLGLSSEPLIPAHRADRPR